ncbi:hypothetical protein G7Y79_00015g038700 [Physcia stellaris]|nr:hypothetical protein G7Y79_00015g038700 [Physcia stellaris]
MDTEASLLTIQIVEETTTLFSELDLYRKNLYRGHSASTDQGVSLRGKTKWAFQAAELQAQRDRVNSMKINILLMMMMMLSNRVPPPDMQLDRVSVADSFIALRAEGEACILRLQDTDDSFLYTEPDEDDDTMTLKSFRTSRTSQTARSTLDSIVNMRRDGTLSEEFDAVPFRSDIEDHEGVARASSIIARFMSATSPFDVDHTPTKTLDLLDSSPSGEGDIDGIFHASTFEISREWFDRRDRPKSRLVFGDRVSVVFPSMYKVVFRHARETALAAEDPTLKIPKRSHRNRAPNTYFIVFRHGFLLFHDDEAQLEVRHVVSLRRFEIDMYSGGGAVLEGDHWPATNAIRLQRSREVTDPPDMQTSEDARKPWFLFMTHDSGREDFLEFYHTLKRWKALFSHNWLRNPGILTELQWSFQEPYEPEAKLSPTSKVLS